MKRNQAQADQIFDSIMKGEGAQVMGKKAGVPAGSIHDYKLMVDLPVGYPKDEEGWNQSVKHLMEVAIWKGAKRMAEGGIDTLELKSIPFTMAVFVDKLLLIRGQPTSIQHIQSVTLTHRDLLKNIKEAKNEKPIINDAVEVVELKESEREDEG